MEGIAETKEQADADLKILRAKRGVSDRQDSVLVSSLDSALRL
jgi:hypothetical protein